MIISFADGVRTSGKRVVQNSIYQLAWPRKVKTLTCVRTRHVKIVTVGVGWPSRVDQNDTST